MSKLNKYFLPKKAGLNPYFSYMGETYSNENEQALEDSLIQEYVQQFGILTTYVCRIPNNMDKVYGESAGSSFSPSFPIEMMPSNYEESLVGRDSVMPFGYNIHDTIELQCSFTRMNEELEKLDMVHNYNRDSNFPQPGDLIYIPFYKTMFEIRFIDSKTPNQPLGLNILYIFTCHMFNPNSETFSTNIDDIDILNQFDEIYNNTDENKKIQDEADNLIIKEPNAWKSLTNPDE